MIAIRLGLSFTDADINTVPTTGGGSSFDGSHYDGAAHQMKTLERWKFYRDDPIYWQILGAEVIDYALPLFSPLPGEEEIVMRESTVSS